MSQPPSDDVLSSQQNMTVVLRLVIDRHGRLSHGEILNGSGTPLGRFFHWSGLTRILQTYVESRGARSSPDSTL